MLNTILSIVTGLFWLMAGAGALDTSPAAETNRAASVYEITSPVPYQVVADQVEIFGSVNSPDMLHFYVEFKPISGGERDWFPATLPGIEPKFADRLGTFNTTTLPDGEYGMRLRVGTGRDSESTLAFGPLVVRNSKKVDITKTREARPVATATDSGAEPRASDVTAYVNSPLPDQVVSGQVDIVGTFDAPDIRGFYFEFRPVGGDDEAKWFPATLPQIKSIRSDVLGTWNTATLKDGDYELRLSANTGDGPTRRFLFGVLKVRNGS